MSTSIFLKVNKEKSCTETSIVQRDNDGLVEITTPIDADLNLVVRSIDGNKLYDLEYQQKKNLEKFRKVIKKMISDYEEECKFPSLTRIKFRFVNEPKNTEACNVDGHGAFLYGNISIPAIYQYYPIEMIEKIVKYYVYDIAYKLEKHCDNIESIGVGCICPNGVEKLELTEVEEPIYKKPFTFEKYEEMSSEYTRAMRKIQEEYETEPIFRYSR